MNLFFARLTGKLMNAEKAEKNNLQQVADAKRFREVEASETYKEFLQLEKLVAEPQFQAKKAEMKKKDWAASEEGKKEARLAALRKNADIVFLQKTDVRKVEEIESWKQTWVAEFNQPGLAKNGFKSGFWFKQAGLKTDFSYVGEGLAYMGERNISISNGILSILTKKEEVEAPAWDQKQGFKMHPFHYSSAVINTGDTFSQPVGMFVAKVKATGKCHSAIHLVGEDRFPVIELFHFNGKKLVVGFTDKNGSEREVIGGIKANDWMILSVAVNRQEIIWSLNNMEVFRAKNPLPGQALHFSCQSFAPADKVGESRMDIAYLKAYTK